MMLYDILVDFPGSQDGTRAEQFTAGTQRELSAYLAAIVVGEGWARPVVETVVATIVPVAENVKIGRVEAHKVKGRK